MDLSVTHIYSSTYMGIHCKLLIIVGETTQRYNKANKKTKIELSKTEKEKLCQKIPVNVCRSIDYPLANRAHCNCSKNFVLFPLLVDLGWTKNIIFFPA